MNTVILNKEDFEDIKRFMDAFGAASVEIEGGNSSGSGYVITAHTNVALNGHFVRVSQVISDESSWWS